MRIIKWLSILLSVSLGANLWFIWYLHKQSTQDNTEVVGKQTQENKSVKPLPNINWQINESSLQNSRTVDSKTTSSIDHGTNTPKPNSLSYLQYLADNGDYHALEYAAQTYLRLNPNDINAMLLEAQAYLHTKSLNTAIIHYQSLLSQALSAEQRQQVLKLIQVNTSNVIQQFTGDGAWNLLAEFLEPLVQVDPLNNQYLLSLARAYGMQQQVGLMENILAALPPDDSRANRLRAKVTARLNSPANGTTASKASMLDEILSSGMDTGQANLDKPADVIISKQRGHFITQARINNRVLDLLLDTGASTTVISESHFSRLKRSELRFLGQFTVSTAGGKIQAPIYRVKEFSIGAITLNNISALVLPSENLHPYDGLLGMNVLSQFDMSFDATSETMRMYKK